MLLPNAVYTYNYTGYNLQFRIKYSPMELKMIIKSLPQKLKSQLKPTRAKFHPKGLLVKSNSADQGEDWLVVPLGKESNKEVEYDTDYSLYREELLDTVPADIDEQGY